ncbi:zinc finger Y-chromosomal protein 2-like [Watersipora subatra]|uniref:zinc finger Y-chromosomal protein 2-like n=1 Tax=Watersipora subatra TaxID=2589382 RepID=UPI00355BB002
MEDLVDPFVEERLAPEHLALLFPATFYQNDESLALHLTESCLVESTTWDGDCAIGETAFWLKVLSTPQTEYLRQQKRLFKLNVAKAHRQFTLREAKARLPVVNALPSSVVEATASDISEKKKPVPRPNFYEKTTPGSVTIFLDKSKEGATDAAANPTGVAVNQDEQKNLDASSSFSTGFGLNSYKCKLCDFATDTRERLNVHQKNNHAAERPYGCEYCDYTSRYPWNIKTHVDNVHLKTKRFKCEHCDFYSPQACLLKRHVNRVHTNAKDVRCPYCDYRANHKDVLKRHVHMKHTGEFDHKCPYCPYGRDAKYEVEDHINAVHLKKVVYQCSECSFQTYRKITLRSHHKDHESKPMLNCPDCSMKSIYPSTMAKHIREEHPNTPMPPDLKDARRKIEQKHIVGGDIDYTPILMCKCKLCDFVCERISKLRAHVRRVHADGSRNKCPVCKAGFANKRNLKNHVMKQHPGIPMPDPSVTTPSAATGEDDATVAMDSTVEELIAPSDDTRNPSNAGDSKVGVIESFIEGASTVTVSAMADASGDPVASEIDQVVSVPTTMTQNETVLYLSDIANLEASVQDP